MDEDMKLGDDDLDLIDGDMESMPPPAIRAPVGEVKAMLFCRECGRPAGTIKDGGWLRTDTDPEWKKVKLGEVSVLCKECNPGHPMMDIQYLPHQGKGYVEYAGLVVHAHDCDCRDCVVAKYLEGAPPPRTAI